MYTLKNIDGKWWVVEYTDGWVPTYNDPDNAGCHPPYEEHNRYPTLESDTSHWQSLQGRELEEGRDFEVKEQCLNTECTCRDISHCYSLGVYAFPVLITSALPIKDPLVEAIVTASIGTRQQHDIIQEHMDDYFTRFPSYKDKLTSLEWYHLFLDFTNKLPIPPQPNDDEVTKDWLKVISKVQHWMNTGSIETKEVVQEVNKLVSDLKQHYTLKQKEQ